MPKKDKQLINRWDDSFYLRVYDLSRRDKSVKKICKSLNCDVDQFREWLRQKPALRASLERGRNESTKVIFKANKIAYNLIQFLCAYAQVGNVMRAAQLSGVAYGCHYLWMKKDEKYPEAFELAQQRADDVLVAEARRRAVEGIRRYKFHQGLPVMVECDPDHPEATEVERPNGKVAYVRHFYELQYSDNMLGRLLESRMPEFRQKGDNVNVNVSAQGDQTIVLSQLLEQMEDAEQDAIDADYIVKEAERLVHEEKGD